MDIECWAVTDGNYVDLLDIVQQLTNEIWSLLYECSLCDSLSKFDTDPFGSDSKISFKTKLRYKISMYYMGQKFFVHRKLNIWV